MAFRIGSGNGTILLYLFRGFLSRIVLTAFFRSSIPSSNRAATGTTTEHPNFLLYNIYFPNGQRDHGRLQYKLDFYDELLPIINEQVESGNNVIVTGDWNTAHHPIDLARPKDNVKTSGFMPIERERLDSYEENGWVDTFRLFHPEGDRYSWWTYRFGARSRNVGWRIDYFFVNEGFTNQVLDGDIHSEIMGSDHCPISLEVEN